MPYRRCAISEKLGVAILDLSTDSSKLEKGLGNAHSKVMSFGKTAGVAVVAITAAAVAGGSLLLDQAGEMQAQIEKAQTVFGDQIGFVEEWADRSAHAMGLTTQEATNAAAAFADLLIPMGFTREEAAKMSTDVVGLSGALSEWSGGTISATEVSKILSSAMLGEREALKGLGISISEADVKQRLLEKGQDKLTGKALEQAEAVATQELIFEKSADAQAKYAEGADSLTRFQNELTASMREYKDEAIKRTIPAVMAVTGFLRRDALPAVKQFAEGVSERMTPALEDFASNAGPALEDFAERFADFWKSDLLPAIESFGEDIMTMWDEVQPALTKIGGLVVDIATTVLEWFRDQWPRIMEFVEPVWTNFKETVELMWETIKDAVSLVTALIDGDWGKAWGKAKEIISNVVQVIISRLKGAKDLSLAFLRLLRDQGLGALNWLKDHGLSAIKDLASGLIDKIRDGAGKVKDLLGDMKDGALNILKRLADAALGKGKDILGGVWDGLKFVKDNILDWLGAAGAFGIGLLAKLGSLAVDALGKGKDILGKLWEGLIFVKDNILDWLGSAGAFGLGLLAKLGSLAVDALGKGKDILGKLWEGLKFVKDNILDWLGSTGSFGKELLGKFTALATDALGKGKDILGKLWEGLKAVKDNITSWLGSTGSFGLELLGKFDDLATDAYSKGEAIFNKLWEGLKALWEKIKSWLSTLNPLDYLPDVDLPDWLPSLGTGAGGGGVILPQGMQAGSGSGVSGGETHLHFHGLFLTSSRADLQKLADLLYPYQQRRGGRTLTTS